MPSQPNLASSPLASCSSAEFFRSRHAMVYHPVCIMDMVHHGHLEPSIHSVRLVAQFKVKMVTADDELTTDIVTSGDTEETTRFCSVNLFMNPASA